MIRFTLPILILLFALTSCEELFTAEPAENELLDGPMDGLTNSQMLTFIKGDEAFGEVFTTNTGLGPYFVTSSCVSCHPGDGKGHPTNTLTRFGRMTGGIFDHMLDQGGPQLQNRSIPGFQPEGIPSGATGVSKFTAPAVTGLGLLAAITDQSILDRADPNDIDGDGISGVPNYVTPPEYFKPSLDHIPNANGQYIGRFGKKAGAIDLLQQTVGAYKQDMGITSEFDMEDPINFAESSSQIAGIDDPEVSTATVQALVFYLHTLKTPLRRDENDVEVLEGESLFTSIGCANCHMPTLTSGKHSIATLSEQTFHPYTDMLMHDMGVDLDDGYTEGTALTSEWRTPPLWGLGLSKDAQGGSYFLMHDGRAQSLVEAISLHGGEGLASKNNFDALSNTEQQSLIKFLESL